MTSKKTEKLDACLDLLYETLIIGLEDASKREADAKEEVEYYTRMLTVWKNLYDKNN